MSKSTITSERGQRFPRVGLVILTGLLLLSVSSAFALQGVHTAQDPALTGVQVESGMGPSPFFNHKGPGADFVKVGVTTRVYRDPLDPPSQTEPFGVTVPGLPPGAVPVATFISWNYLIDGTPPDSDLIYVNADSVWGYRVGDGSPDLCWNKDGVVSYKAYNLTALIGPGAAPILVTVANATDKPLGTDTLAYGEGLSILVVYEIPGKTHRNVDVYCGYSSTESNPSGPFADVPLDFSEAYTGGGLHLFINNLDGQISPDSFLIEGTNVGGLFAGVVSATDAWQGLLGPSASGFDNLYDHGNDDASPYVAAPATGIQLETRRGNDCVGHSFAAVSFLRCEEGGTSIIEPDTLYYYMKYAIEPISVCIFIGSFCDCPVTEIDQESILINGSAPDSVEYLPSHPDFTGAVLKAYVGVKDFLDYYGTFLDWGVYQYVVTGDFLGQEYQDCVGPFELRGIVSLRGHISGDVNLDGRLTVTDITYLVAYLFQGGPVPPLPETADVDKDGQVTVADLSDLVETILK